MKDVAQHKAQKRKKLQTAKELFSENFTKCHDCSVKKFFRKKIKNQHKNFLWIHKKVLTLVFINISSYNKKIQMKLVQCQKNKRV